MALSEHEQRLLDEMERNLLQNDADVVAPADERRPLSSGAVVLGVIVGLAGLGLVIAGVAFHQPLIGVLGFALMFVGVLIGLRRSGRPASRAGSGPGRSASGPSRGQRASFMSTLEDRWDRRRDES